MINHTDGSIPDLISKQEKLYDDTMIKIQNFATLIAGTINAYGENLINSTEGVLTALFFLPEILKKESLVTTFQ